MYDYSTHLIPEVPCLTFHQFKGTESLVTCYENPSVETLPVLKEVYGVNTLITSIMHIDQLYYTKVKTDEIGMDYINVLFFDTPKVIIKHQDFKLDQVARDLKNLWQKIKNEKRTLLIHPSGGSLKMGILTYCLLRMSGEQRDDALKILLNLRKERKNGFGEFRIMYAEKKLVPLLINDELI